jgi:glycerophosphoryl diester phosphodiesterase
MLPHAGLSRVAHRSGFSLARLIDVADAVRGAGSLIAEVKHDRSTDCPTRLVSAVLETISEAGLGVDEVVVSSFSAAVLADVSRKAPGIRRALVTQAHIPAAAGLNEALAWEHHELHAHLAAVLAHPQIAEQAREHGCQVTCWNVNRSCDVRLLEAAGVHGVITDDPGAMRASLLTGATMPTLAGLPA